MCFYPILSCASLLPVTAMYNPIHDSGLCGQMQVLRMNYWYIFEHERPTQEQLHEFLFFTPIFILGCASVLPLTGSLYTRKPYTSFWLVWPNAGLLHELFVIFLARKGQHKNSYVDYVFFYPSMKSSLCI